jgi:hypothetical protein
MTTSFILHLNDLMPYGEVAGPAGAMRVAKRKVALTGGNPVNFEVHTSSRIQEWLQKDAFYHPEGSF